LANYNDWDTDAYVAGTNDERFYALFFNSSLIIVEIDKKNAKILDLYPINLPDPEVSEPYSIAQYNSNFLLFITNETMTDISTCSLTIFMLLFISIDRCDGSNNETED
jgi:hypothetical protein